jgi:hypothetical protein
MSGPASCLKYKPLTISLRQDGPYRLLLQSVYKGIDRRLIPPVIILSSFVEPICDSDVDGVPLFRILRRSFCPQAKLGQ